MSAIQQNGQASSYEAAYHYLKTIASGAASATVAVGFFMPMQAVKNALQSNFSIPSDSNDNLFQKIKKMYRGGGGFAASFAPTIALQVLIADILSKCVHPAIAAAGGGAISTLIVNPTELVINHKQMNGKSLKLNLIDLISKFGFKILGRGAIETGFREGLFTLGYAYCSPLMKSKFKDMKLNDLLASILAGCTSAAPMVLLTQTADTIKTRKQRDPHLKVSWSDYFKVTSFAGLKWRYGMASTAITVIALTQEVFKRYF